MSPHATSLVAAVGVAFAIIKHTVAVAFPISGKASASTNKPVEAGCRRAGV